MSYRDDQFGYPRFPGDNFYGACDGPAPLDLTQLPDWIEPALDREAADADRELRDQDDRDMANQQLQEMSDASSVNGQAADGNQVAGQGETLSATGDVAGDGTGQTLWRERIRCKGRPKTSR